MPALYPGQNVTDDSLRVTIKIEGSPIDDSYMISNVRIHHEINKISTADILITCEYTADSASLPFTDSDVFTPGKSLVVTAAYGSDAETSLFTGVIVRHGIEMRDESGGIFLRLLCKHTAVSMTFGRREAYFVDKPDSDIISTICTTYGLSATVGSTTYQNETFTQKLASDWDLMLSRAEFNGFVISMDGDSFTVNKPALSGTAVLRVAPGEGLKSFQAELSAERQAPAVTASAWDIKNLALQSVSGTEPSVNAQGNLTAKKLSDVLSQVNTQLTAATPMATDELRAWADNHLLRMRLAAFKGTVTFMGSPLAKTNTLITLEGVGAKFNGDAYVSAVTHTLEEGQWNTLARFGLDSKGINERADFSYLPATGQIPVIQGLQVGTVKSLYEDPQKMYRIQVTIPTKAEQSTDVWARYANFYGTANAGSGFMPEIGDEVILGFIEDDPRYPVILGSLYGSSKQSPNPASDNNNYQKLIATKSQLKVSFDDEKKVIVISTPGGNSVTLSDDAKSVTVTDQHSNSITMDSSGIVINSSKDLTLKAAQNITVSGGAKVSIAAQTDLAGSGMNVSLNANMGFTGKGGTTAELSAAGQTTVKGGMVMIN